MKNDPGTLRYIIILGTTFSGASAIFEYLDGRGDLYNPLEGKEYELPQLPNGLMSLEAAAEKAFDPATAEFALSHFEETANKLFQSWVTHHNDKNFVNRMELFKSEIKKFVNEISAVDFPMRLNWRQYKQSPIQYFISKLKRCLNFNETIPQTRILVTQDELVQAAQNLHNRMFQVGAEGRPVLLDQAGSGWNPAESTKYFLHNKVVVVTRNPCDQFLSIKKRKKANSVEGFVNWYIEMQKRLKKINNPNIIFIKFEDFVMENEKTVNKLCDYLHLSTSISSSYEPNLSKDKISKSSNILSQNEVDYIEKHLSSYIYRK